MPVTLRSHAKINLGLAIGPTRPDGFHALRTLYATLDAHDLVTVSVERGGVSSAPPIVLTSNDKRVPLDARNTVWKMLQLALGAPGRDKLRVRVHMEKRLPIQGGLGGGSGNAAAALLGMEREISQRRLAPALSGAERLRMAAEVGSDVPVFLLGGTVLGLGRGEEVVPLADLQTLPAIVALPDTGVSTPAAFRAWDAAQAASGLTSEAMNGRLEQLSRALAAAWCESHTSGVPLQMEGSRAGTLLSTLVQTGILLNDFEEVVFRQHPFLAQIKRALAGPPGPSGSMDPAGFLDACARASDNAPYCALSGSGSAVFGLYPEPAATEAAGKRLDAIGVRYLRTATVSRADYWAGMVVK